MRTLALSLAAASMLLLACGDGGGDEGDAGSSGAGGAGQAGGATAGAATSGKGGTAGKGGSGAAAGAGNAGGSSGASGTTSAGASGSTGSAGKGASGSAGKGAAGKGASGSGTAGSGAGGSGASGSGTAGSGAGGSGAAGSGTAGSGTAGSGTAGSSGAPALGTCDAPLFVDDVPSSAWVELKVNATGGMQAIRQAIHTARDAHASAPVRIRLGPGFYADNVGAELYVQRILRPATAPIWIVAEDPTPNATRLGHGLNFVGVAYFAFEGLTIGPSTVGAWNGKAHADPQPLAAQAGIHIAGAAKNGGKSAKVGGGLDASIYGQYEPSHHIAIRNVTIQNVFSPDAKSAVTDEGQSMDGIKLNQVEDAWVVGTTVESTSRHGIDNVGVHRAVFCGNTIAHTGGGLGIEAKGGSVDVLYERNVFFDVRRVELGGEATDATYYFSSDGLYSYEARGTIARNNLIVDAREAALELSGCLDCAALQNSILFTPSYVAPGGNNASGGDAIRVHDSVLIGANDGAGSDCVSWSDAQQDYVYFDVCWGVGSNAPAPTGTTLPTKNARIVDNVFVSAGGIWHNPGGLSTIPCPLNPTGGTPLSEVALDGNHWWNGGKVIADADGGCPVVPEGPASTYSTKVVTADPLLTSLVVNASPFSGLRLGAANALRPSATSPLVGAAVTGVAGGSSLDFGGVARPSAWSIGALEP